MPQAPQFAASLAVSTHDCPHVTRGAEHALVAVHAPSSQSSVDAHALAQAPQFFGSVRRFTHVPEQTTSPVGHAPAAPPLPDFPAVPVAPA